MVLFHCTFLSLKCNSNLLLAMDPSEFQLRGEEKVFQACVAP